MPLYESTYITRQDISSQEVEKLADAYTKVIGELNGQVKKIEQWGLRDLAYPIKKCTKGYYTFMGIDAPIEAINEMERKIKLNEDIIRCFTVRVEEIEENPSPLIAPDDSGDEIVIGGKEDRVERVTTEEGAE